MTQTTRSLLALIPMVVGACRGASTGAGQTMVPIDGPATANASTQSIPGTIDLAGYDEGEDGVAYHDVDTRNWVDDSYRPGVDVAPGAAMGWIQAGEWIDYTVSVASGGTYELRLSTSHPGPGGTMHVEFGGVDATGPLQIPDTGDWDAYRDLTAQVTLAPGAQVMRLVFDSDGAGGFVGNVASLSLTPADGPTTTAWPHEPPGATVLLDCPFSGSLCNLRNDYDTSAFASFDDAPLSPSGAMDTFLAAGSSYGNGQWGLDLARPQEIYVGAWWQTNADFVGMCNNTNKMLFVRQPAIDNNFLGWQGLPGQPKTLKWYDQATYDNCGGPGEYGMCYSQGDGTGWFEPNTADAAAATVAAGSGWHRIELYLKASTSKTSRDGIIRWWVDGKLVGDYPAVNLSPGGFDDFQINHTWDGSNCLVPPNRDMTKAWHHYWDHMRISVPHS